MSRSRSHSRGSARSSVQQRSRSASRSPRDQADRSRSRSPQRSRSRGPRRSRSRSSSRRGPGEKEVKNPGNQIYVNGLRPNCTNNDLRERFEKIGEIEEASVVMDPHHNECRGFGFVRFRTVEEANEAIRQEHGTQFMGNVLTVQHSIRKCARPKTPGEYLGRSSDRYESRSRRGSPPRRSRRESPYGRRDYPSRSDSRYRRSNDYYPSRSDSRHRRSRDDHRRDDRYESRRRSRDNSRY